MRARSLRARMTLVTIAAMSVLLVVVASATAIVLRSQLDHDLTRRLEARSLLATQLPAMSADDLATQLSDRDISAIVTRDGVDIIAGDPQRADDYRSVYPAEGDAVIIDPTGAEVLVDDNDRLDEETAIARRLPDGTVITLIGDLERIDDVVLRLIGVEAVVSLISMVLIVASIGRLTGRALHPLDEMVAVAERIADGERGTRLEPDRVDTDMGRLGASFDTMVDSLEASIERAEASERTMRQFVADASHELRNPAAAIAATSEMLLHGDRADDTSREQLELNLVRDGRRLGRLVGDLLDVARLEDPAAPLHSWRVDLVELASEEATRARMRHPAAVIELTGEDELAAEVEPDGVTRVIANLVDNAARHAEEGTPITVDVGRTLEVAVVTVTNDGPPISPEDRERIFERFTRLDGSRARVAGGSGLGLSISRSIARRHGGSLRCVDPPDGRGARFELRLPLSRGDAAVTSARGNDATETRESH